MESGNNDTLPARSSSGLSNTHIIASSGYRYLPHPMSLPIVSTSQQDTDFRNFNLSTHLSTHSHTGNTSNCILPPMPLPLKQETVLHLEPSLLRAAILRLQAEHKSLLANCSQLKARARTLEKAHVTLSNEVNDLTDENQRLKARVRDLEQCMEELSQSRHNCQRAAIRESAQYAEIVSKLSKLERMRHDAMGNGN
jgi:cell division protein FtsB